MIAGAVMVYPFTVVDPHPKNPGHGSADISIWFWGQNVPLNEAVWDVDTKAIDAQTRVGALEAKVTNPLILVGTCERLRDYENNDNKGCRTGMG